jgi:uncharacterized protein
VRGISRLWGEDRSVLEAAGLDLARLAEWEERTAAVLHPPAGATIVDAHAHLGHDADGHRLAPEDLLADMDAHGVHRAVCFPADEPGEDGRFSLANWEVARAAAASGGRLIPFCRVHPRRAGAREVMDRAAAEGARGLKLHPVAQRFRPEDPAVIVLVRAAAERGWPVLIHAGFGARPLAAAIARLSKAVPDATLILAHGGRGDARALAALARERPRIAFDTSLASPADLVGLEPERLCFGADRPYGEHATALAMVGAVGRLAGWTEAQIAGVLGSNILRLLGDGG